MAQFNMKTARVVGGAAVLGSAIQNVLPPAGESFSLPAADTNGVLNFYLPVGVGLVAIFPFKNSKMIASVGLVFVGGKRIFLDGNTAFTASNVIGGYIPLLSGAFLLLR